ncbi:hypothetical protein BD410DRAFT_387499 [Rickenella mellea]|uniref:Uncharacterized protein n=1 Tax=Rickenella mellea TaxID=50990 RepID=A0A4Y7PEG3_9AGAM|nr:hypothetical protein BD410DRAFT_387499 [Rickenella mellea]
MQYDSDVIHGMHATCTPHPGKVTELTVDITAFTTALCRRSFSACCSICTLSVLSFSSRTIKTQEMHLQFMRGPIYRATLVQMHRRRWRVVHVYRWRRTEKRDRWRRRNRRNRYSARRWDGRLRWLYHITSETGFRSSRRRRRSRP